VFVTATIRILCEARPSLGTACVNGFLALATMTGGGTALGAGLPAALVALDATRTDVRADMINRGLGIGFVAGAAAGVLTLIVFVARIVS